MSIRVTRFGSSTIMAALSVWVAAGSAPPGSSEKAVLDQALNAVSIALSRDASLETLEDVAEGKPREVVTAAALKAGLRAFARPDFSFADASVRAYAMDRIGASGLPEAIQDLESITVAEIGPDDTETIYPASQIALYKALYRRETDPGRQVALLAPHRRADTRRGGLWAVDELCNRGSNGSLPEIRKMVESYPGGLSGGEQVRFCEGADGDRKSES